MDENNNQVASEATEVSSIETMDDLDNLLAEDGEKKAPTPVVTKAEEETKTEEPAEDKPAEEPEEPKKPTDGGKVTENNTSKANDAFAAMRAQLNQQNKLFQKLANSKGMSVEALKEALDKEATKEAAAQLNVTPEVYERLTKLEEENKAKAAQLEALQDARRREYEVNRLTTNIEKVQKEQGLSDNQVKEFVKETVDMGMDLLKGNVPLNILYKGMKYDELVKVEVEKAKQEVIAQYSKADKYAASTVKSSGNADKETNTITDMAALDALFGTK